MISIGGIKRDFTGCPAGGLRFGMARPADDVVAAALPSSHMIIGFPRDRDQSTTNACVEFSIAECFEYLSGGRRFSPLYGYFYARLRDGDSLTDNIGLPIPLALAAAQWQGLCYEETWPFDPASIAVAPPVNAIIEAHAHRALRIEPVADLLHLQEMVAGDIPVILGFSVPESIGSEQTARTGEVTYRNTGDPIVGRHAVVAIAYDNARRRVGCTSHWGHGFGDGGLIWLPYSAFQWKYANDLYALRAVSGAVKAA